jgi:hypothetical protein
MTSNERRGPQVPRPRSQSSKPAVQVGDLSHLTPTFPSNPSQELNSEVRKPISPNHPAEEEAYHNIERLIQRYEMIKDKPRQ